MCLSQVHGVVWDTIEFVNGILTTEMNSATDNPVSFYVKTIISSVRSQKDLNFNTESTSMPFWLSTDDIVWQNLFQVEKRYNIYLVF